MIDIEELIRTFHISARYKGYHLIIEAIQIIVDSNVDYFQISKDVYPRLMIKYDTSMSCIERNIRTVVEHCWRNNKELLNQIFGYELIKSPTNTEFIDYVSYYIVNNKKARD